MPGIEITQINVIGRDDEPPVPSRSGHIAEGELDDGSARRYRAEVDVAMDIPHEKVRIEVLVPEIGHPADAPLSERLDDRTEFLPRGCQGVADPVAFLEPLDDPSTDKRPQPGGQQRRRHPRNPAPQLVEVPGCPQVALGSPTSSTARPTAPWLWTPGRTGRRYSSPPPLAVRTLRSLAQATTPLPPSPSTEVVAVRYRSGTGRFWLATRSSR